ncbi:MAG: hypothetical protein ABI550_05995 [Ignavibacteriaceae bacterium]
MILRLGITSQLFLICYEEILEKYKIKNLRNSYCIIALGKLGGNELNYSSDIDLIIFYDRNSTLTNHKEYFEILTESIFLFIESASSITSAGYIYRVDFRLRPDGRASRLTRSIQDYLNYYESRGEDWERQMLIKASFVGGDKKLYENFINYLQPFIYPSSFSVSPNEQIKRLKNNIEKNLKDDENIKLFPGGIRDIEFSVQALQLINGGKNKIVRANNTLDGIEKLEQEKLLTKNEAETFSSAYIFYRRIEHYLQLMNDTQTHSIPTDGEILEKLSNYLTFKNPKDFKVEVEKNRNKIKKIYVSIIGDKVSVEIKKDKLLEINFDNKNKAEKDILYLREGKGLLGQKEFDKASIESFNKIEPVLFEYLKHSISPDLVLQNFVRVLRNITFPSIWYSQFSDKKFFISFLTLCEFSQKSIDLFAEDEDLREYFLTRKVFEKPLLKVSQPSVRNVQIFTLKKLLFALSLQLSLSLIKQEKLSQILSSFFKQKIKEIAKNLLKFENSSTEIFIAGLGSFSINEMTFASDIDLIFAVKNIHSEPNIENKFQSFLLKLKEEFKPFEVDCRLRPEGKSSQLVWELKSYKNYFEKRARIWELQAFTKMNFVYGSKKLYDQLVKSFVERTQKESKQNLQREMIEMRKKLHPQNPLAAKNFNIKKSRGGISDIEFVVQYLLLSNPNYLKKNIGEGNYKTLNFFIDSSHNFDDLNELKNNFRFLKKLEITNQNIFNSSTPMIIEEEKKYLIFARSINIKSINDFKNLLALAIKKNNSVFNKYFEI